MNELRVGRSASDGRMLNVRIVAATLLSAICAVSQGADRSEKLHELMELQGVAQTVDQQLQSSRERTQQMAHQTLDKMLSTLNPPEEFRRRFTEASDEFISAAQTPWSGQEVADTWTKYYGAQFSDKELDQLLKFYKSPLGKKDVAAVHEAMGPYTAELHARYKPILEKAIQQFIDRLQVIVKECNCQKEVAESPAASDHPRSQ